MEGLSCRVIKSLCTLSEISPISDVRFKSSYPLEVNNSEVELSNCEMKFKSDIGEDYVKKEMDEVIGDLRKSRISEVNPVISKLNGVMEVN